VYNQRQHRHRRRAPVPTIGERLDIFLHCVVVSSRARAERVMQSQSGVERRFQKAALTFLAIMCSFAFGWAQTLSPTPNPSCVDDTWTATSLTNAPTARSGHTAIWTGNEMIVCEVQRARERLARRWMVTISKVNTQDCSLSPRRWVRRFALHRTQACGMLHELRHGCRAILVRC